MYYTAMLFALALLLVGCKHDPYHELSTQVLRDVYWVSQGSNDPQRMDCPKQGDCDDRALCAACRLIQQGAAPQSITVVLQGWKGNNPHNHLAIEYNGHCILGYNTTSYEGMCKHPWKNDTMIERRYNLPNYIKLYNVKEGENCK